MRTRCPTLMSAPSAAGTSAVTLLRDASIAPAVRTQTWIGRTATSVVVSVSSLACDSVTAVDRFGVGRVCSRTPWSAPSRRRQDDDGGEPTTASHALQAQAHGLGLMADSVQPSATTALRPVPEA